jgi:plastocyanin
MLVLAAGLLAACGGSSGAEVNDPDAIRMKQNAFSTSERSIPRGGTVTFVNEARGAPHILVIGLDGGQRREPGAPSFGGAAGHRSNAGDAWTTPPFNATGTFHITCTVHPDMNLTVAVT